MQTPSPPEPLGLTEEQRHQSNISEHLAPMFAEATAQIALNEKLQEIFTEKIEPLMLPKREPGTHWTGPSGEHRHIEVPITGRTLTNVRNWGRAIT